MPLSDAELFDFNGALIDDYDDEKAHATLDERGDAFRYQLVMALHLDWWAARLEQPGSPASQSLDAKEVTGWVNALRNVAAFVRKGEYLPGGSHYEQVQARTGE